MKTSYHLSIQENNKRSSYWLKREPSKVELNEIKLMLRVVELRNPKEELDPTRTVLIQLKSSDPKKTFPGKKGTINILNG